MSVPKVETSYFPMGGGLDLLTPPISLTPGKCFDCQNYEPQISGGYRRINGYERYDGNVNTPTAAKYWILGITLTGTIAVGATITGGSSAATGRVLAVKSGTYVLGRVSGVFVQGENVLASAAIQGITTGSAIIGGASLPSDDADYKLLAANDRRADILAVPGSGKIRGVCVYNGILYAFRDDVLGAGSDMYKATAAGWAKITLGKEILFSTPTAEIKVGYTVTGGTSGAHGVAIAVLLRVGTWTVAGAGSIVFATVTGTFQSGEALTVGGVSMATSSSLCTQISRLPGGTLDLVTGNFTGSTSTEMMFGSDGTNPAFSFDGTTYVPIHTGMAVDTPSHIYIHKFMMFLSFLGSVQFSALGNPYAWTVVLGAGEIATGDVITGFIPNAGDYVSGSTLQILTRETLYTLYGASSGDFKLVLSIGDIGFFPHTAQLISNNAYGLTNRGIQAIITTLAFGDFDYASVSHLVQPLITAKRGMETCSTTSKTKNQYRLYFNDGTGLVVGLTGDKDNGIMLLNYGIPVRCIATATLTTGEEVCYFGSDDGYVYRDNVGTSFDGAVIESWIRPAFNNLKSPQIRKSFKRAVFEVATEGYSQVQVTYDMGYGNPDVSQSPSDGDIVMSGAGGYWDQFTWDQFTWDSPVYATPSISITGTEKNISFFFYSNRAQDMPHTVTGCSISYIFRRPERTY